MWEVEGSFGVDAVVVAPVTASFFADAFIPTSVVISPSVAFDAASGLYNAIRDDKTWSHAGHASRVRGVVVYTLHFYGNSGNVTGVTYGGVAMSLVATVTNGAFIVRIWVLTSNIPQGTQTVLTSGLPLNDYIGAGSVSVTADGPVAYLYGTQVGTTTDPSIAVAVPDGVVHYLSGGLVTGSNSLLDGASGYTRTGGFAHSWGTTEALGANANQRGPATIATVAQSNQGIAFGALAFYDDVPSVSPTVDAVILRTQTPSFAADAVISHPYVRATQVVAEVVAVGDPTMRSSHVVLEVVWATAPFTFPVNSTFLAERESSYHADAWVQTVVVSSFGADAWLAGTFTLDALFSELTSFSFTADAHVISSRTEGSLSANAILMPKFTAGAVVLAEGGDLTYAYAIKRVYEGGSFTFDAVVGFFFSAKATIFGGRTGAKTADSVLKVRRTFSSTADAEIAGRIFVRSVLIREQESHLHLDAEVRALGWNADATIFASPSQWVFANAILKSPPVIGSFEAEALLYLPEAFSAYATIFGAQGSSFSVDAVITYPEFYADAVFFRTMREDNTQPVFAHDNLLVVEGTREAVFPHCTLTILPGVRLRTVELFWTVWISQDKNFPWAEQTLQARLRLRRTNTLGEVLFEYTWPVQSGNWVDGHRQMHSGSYVDTEPTDGIYALTVQEIQGNGYSQIWSNAQEFSSTLISPALDAVIDGPQGYHVSQGAVEALVTLSDVPVNTTQNVVEAAIRRMDVPVYISQNVVEALYAHSLDPPDVRITQSALEVLLPHYRQRFQAWAVLFREFVVPVPLNAALLLNVEVQVPFDAVIVPLHTMSNAVTGVVILDEPEDHVGDFYGLPYLYKGIISFTFWPGSDYSISWHGGYVGVTGSRAYVSDADDRLLLWQDFVPTFGWWHVRFSVDSGYGSRVYLKVWQDEEPYWTAEAYGPDAPPTWGAAGRSAGSMTDIQMLTVEAPWRFDDAFTAQAWLGTSASLSADAVVLRGRSGSCPASSVIRRERTASSTLDAVIAPIYPTFTVDAFVWWYIAPPQPGWHFWVSADIQRGFFVNAILGGRILASAVIGEAPAPPSFVASAAIHRPVGVDTPGSFRADATRSTYPVAVFIAKAWVEGLPQPDRELYVYSYISTGRKFTLDARMAVITHPEGSFSLDAETSETYRTNVFDAEATILKSEWWHFWAGAVMAQKQPDPTTFFEGTFEVGAFIRLSFTLDAEFWQPPSWTLDAFFLTTFIKHFRFDAQKADIRHEFRVDAVLMVHSDSYPIWMTAEFLGHYEGSFSLQGCIEQGFRINSVLAGEERRDFAAQGFIKGKIHRYFPHPQPGEDHRHLEGGGGFNQNNYTRRVSVLIGTSDVTEDVLWQESSFTMAAKSATGNFHLALRGVHGAEMGAVVYLEVDGIRQFGGILLREERTYFQPDVMDASQTKTIFEGADFNFVLDRIIIHNPETKPMEGATDVEEYIPISPAVFAPGTTDAGAIQIVFTKYLTDLPDWFSLGGLIPSAVVSTVEEPLKLGDPEQTLRALLFEFVRLSDTVFWVDPYGALWYAQKGSYPAPMDLSKGGQDGVGIRSLEVTSDISNGVSVAIVWGTLLTKTSQMSTTDPGKVYGKFEGPIGGIPPWMQIGEYNGNTLHREKHVDLRAKSLVDRKGKVIWTASARTTEIGFMVGQNVGVEGAGENLVIKQVTVGFYIGGGGRAVVYWDLQCGVLPDDPWTYFDFIPYG